MKRIIIFATVVLLGVACKSTPDKAVSMYKDIEEAANSNNPERVEELVEEMTVWYDNLSKEEKAQADKQISNYRYVQQTMAEQQK